MNTSLANVKIDTSFPDGSWMGSLKLLEETLSRSTQLTDGMVGILTSFEDRLMKLEQTILPVYQETGNLQRRQENIEKTLSSLDHVIAYHNVGKQVENIIKDGPNDRIDQFIESLSNVNNAIEYFEDNNPESTELANLSCAQHGDTVWSAGMETPVKTLKINCSEPKSEMEVREKFSKICLARIIKSHPDILDNLFHFKVLLIQMITVVIDLFSIFKQTLFDSGSDALQREFRAILTKHSNPTPAIVMHDVVGLDDEELPEDVEHASMPQIPGLYLKLLEVIMFSTLLNSWHLKKTLFISITLLETSCNAIFFIVLPLFSKDDVIQDLIKISNWLLNNNKDDFLNVYTAIRANVVNKTLQNLKDHQKTHSGSSFNLVPVSSPSMVNKLLLKTSRRIQQALKKKGAAALARYSQSLDSSRFGLNIKRPTSSTTEPRNDELDPECDFYMVFVSALLKLMQNRIVKTIEAAKINTKFIIIYMVLVNFKRDGERLEPCHLNLDHATRQTMFMLKSSHTTQFDFSSRSTSCEAEWKLMQNIIPKDSEKRSFERIIHQGIDSVVQEGENLATRARRCILKHDFLSVLSIFPMVKHVMQLQSEFDVLLVGAKALEDFIENIRNDMDKQMPKDGTVHQQTSNVMMFLEQLLDYDSVGVMAGGQDAINILSANSPDLNRKLLAKYIVRVLSALGLSLQNKAEFYSDPYLKAVFKLNNLHYILKSIQRHGLIEIIAEVQPGIEDYYQDQITDQKRLYSQSWSRVLHFVMEVDKPISQQKVTPINSQVIKLKDKERQIIKDKFTGFNKEIEEICRIQKGYAIPDVELRETMKRDNKEYILPKFQMFYDKYSNIHFTKNTDKYLKFTPRKVDGFINEFFDAAA
ncbi:Exocyst complex component 7 [Nymphon striatum]|nr:Exocyst complex component 7 [Nymphon striatum]